VASPSDFWCLEIPEYREMNKDKANKNSIQQLYQRKDGNVFMWLASERACGTIERGSWNSDQHLPESTMV